MSTLIAPLYVVRGMRLRQARRLPVDGNVVVDIGEQVSADDVLARAEIAGPVVRLNLVETLGLKTSEEAVRCFLKSSGDAVQAGEEIARKKGPFGRGDRTCTSPIGGRLISGPTMSGDVLIAAPAEQFELQALIAGRVVGILPQRGAVVEGVGDFIQCLSCLGGETQGTIRMTVDDPSSPLDADAIDESCSGSILVAGSVDETALRAALFMGVRAAVVGSITPTTFRWLRDNPQPVTVMLTEGFGAMPMARGTFDLLSASEGRAACIFSPDDNSGPSPAAVFIPTSSNDGTSVDQIQFGRDSKVRVVRGHAVGAQARVVELPSRGRILDSGTRSEIVRLAGDDGQELVVGRNSVELVG